MQRLRSAGLNIEEAGLASDRRVTVSRYKGRPLLGYVERGTFKDAERVFLQAFELIGKVHAQGVLHGHPHLGNLLLKNGKVWLTDFRLARNVRPEWGKPRRICNTFYKDYDYLSGVLTNYLGAHNFSLDWSRAFTRSCFERLYAQYPCSADVKKTLLDSFTSGA